MDETEKFYIENSELHDYYVALEPAVKQRILASDATIATIGELKLCVENLRKDIQSEYE